MKILTIGRNTFRENIRDKILYNLILFALLMILSSIALGQLTLGHEAKVIVDLGLGSISIFGTLIAIFIGISLVYKELEKRTVYALLAKPIHRWEFITGKYLGLLFTLLVNVAIMAAGLMLTLLYQGGIERYTYLNLLPAIYLTLLSLMVTTALALVFSTFVYVFPLGCRPLQRRSAGIWQSGKNPRAQMADPCFLLRDPQHFEFQGHRQPECDSGCGLF